MFATGRTHLKQTTGGSWITMVSRRSGGFTLIEVLVVVAIIALLISILMPSLAGAREQAKGSLCLSHLRQVGTGLTMYILQNKDRYPMHSSLKSQTVALGKPRTRWPDYLHTHMRSEDVYECPSLTPEQKKDFAKPWAHNPSKTYGGYGYNFQYLGNARHFAPGGLGPGAPQDWSRSFHAQASNIRQPALTVGVGDTRGSKKGDSNRRFGEGAAAVYVLDPPLGSKELGSQGSRKNKTDPNTNNLWYEGGTDFSEEDLVRSAPDKRHRGKANIAFCDGHAELIDVDRLDGRRNGGTGDNRYYNGLFDLSQR